MKKNLIVLILLVAGVAGVYFWANDSAQKIAIQELSKAEEAIKSELGEDIRITYDFKDFGLFSKILNIENLSVKNSSSEIKIPKLSILIDGDTFSIDILEKSKIVEIGTTRTIAEIASISINNISIEKMRGSKKINDLQSTLYFINNLKFESVDLLKAKIYNQDRMVPTLEISQLSLNNINSGILGNIVLKGFILNGNDQKINLVDANINNLNITKLKDFASDIKTMEVNPEIGEVDGLLVFNKFVKSIEFENLEVNKAMIRKPISGIIPAKISHLSIGTMNSGILKNTLMQGLVIQDGQIVSLNSAKIDKFDLGGMYSGLYILSPYATEIDKEGAFDSLMNSFDLGSIEVNGINVKDPDSYDDIDINSINFKVGRKDKIVNLVEMELLGFEVDKSKVAMGLGVPGALESIKEDKIKLDLGINFNIDFNTGEGIIDFSLGIDRIGKFNMEIVQGGYSESFYYNISNNLEGVLSNPDKLYEQTTFKSMKYSFSNDGLLEIIKKEANLSVAQIDQILSQEIGNLEGILSNDLRQRSKKALITFIKSGKGIEISLKSKDKDGISQDKINQLLSFSIPFDKYVELDIKGE
jgi:hypothetical protein